MFERACVRASLNVPTYFPLTLSMCLLVSRFGPGLCRVEEDEEGPEVA